MRALQHRQKYLACGSSVLLAGGELCPPSIFRCSLDQIASPMLMLLLSLPHLTPLFNHSSIGPLSDDNQHEAPISTPTLHVGHLRPHHLLAVSSCANLPASCAIRYPLS